MHAQMPTCEEYGRICKHIHTINVVTTLHLTKEHHTLAHELAHNTYKHLTGFDLKVERSFTAWSAV
jgi:hypothetical protein